MTLYIVIFSYFVEYVNFKPYLLSKYIPINITSIAITF